jgi:hypothetical protein
MPIQFEKRPIEENTWKPEVAGIDFTEKLMDCLAHSAAQGAEVWIAWVTVEADGLGEGYDEQVTPENTRTFMSQIDDDSDMVSYFDKRDGQWFTFYRFNHQEIFDSVVQTILPWSTNTVSIAPNEQIYERMIASMTNDANERPDWLDK